MNADDFLDAPDAESFLGDEEPPRKGPKLPPGPRFGMGRGNAPTRAPQRIESVLQQPGNAESFAAAPDPSANAEALFNALQNNPDLIRSPMYAAGAGVLRDAANPLEANPVQAAVTRGRRAQLAERQKQQRTIAAREQTDEAFGGPLGQAVAAPGRRLASGVAQVVGGVASIPQLFGSDLGRDTSEAAALMAGANMPEDPGIADEVLAGAGQLLPMIGGAGAVRALALPLLGEAGATGLATTLSGAAGGAMTGGEVLRDLENRFDLTDEEKRRRALLSAAFSALTSKYADRFLIPGADKAATGPLNAGVRALFAEGAQEGLDQAGQNVATDRPLGQGVGRAALIGGLVGGGARVASDVSTPDFQLAQAIEADANAFANAPRPPTIWAPSEARVAPPMAPSPAPAPAPVPALPYDPSVKAGPDIMVAGQDGTARPMTAAEFLEAEDARQEGVDTGLTPDVRRAQEARTEPTGDVKVEPDLVQRLMAAGWQPPKDTNVAPRETTAAAAAADQDAAPQGTAAAGAAQPARADGADGVRAGQPDAALNPNAQPDDVLGDFERLYQQDVKDGIRERLGITQRAEPEAAMKYAESPLIRGIAAAGGIEKGQMSDTGVDGKRQTRTARIMPNPYNVARRPLFRDRSAQRAPGEKAPLRGDMLVEHLVQTGYLTQQEVDEADANGVGSSEELAYDIIRRELESPGSVRAVGQRADPLAGRARRDLEQQASAIGFDIGGMDEPQIAAALKRIERRRAQATARKEQFDAREEARLERQAIQDADAFTLEQLDALDADWLAGDNVTTADAMMALGFDPAEIETYAAREAENRRSAEAPDGDARGAEARAGAADEGSESSLESYSPDEVVGRQERAAQAERDQQRQQQDTDNRARADAQRGDFTLTGSDRAADANPDQEGLFRRGPSPEPETATSTADTMRSELRERFGPIVDRLEKRGILKLWDSVDAYNEAGQASRLPADARGVQGMYSRGVAHLFGDGVEPGNAVPVFLHEVGEHASMKAMLGPRYSDLVRRAYRLVADGDEIAQTAMDRIPDDTPAKFQDSELLAYMIEETAAREQRASPAARSFLRDVIAAIRAWFYQTGLSKQLERYGARLELTPKDIAALAVRAVRWQAEQEGGKPAPASSTPVDIELSKAPPTDSEAFRRWFGDSKVVDAQGKPLVVYHGTDGDVSEFAAGRANYFTADPGAASIYAEGFGKPRDGANVAPTYLSIKNPKWMPLTDSAKLTASDLAAIKADGFDGVFGWVLDTGMSSSTPIAREVGTGQRGMDKIVTEAIPAAPEQIKSAIGNRGTFDPENSDIRFSKRAPFSATGSNPYAGQKFGPQPWTVAEPGAWDNIVRTLQNNKVDMKRVRDAIEQRFGRIPEAKDAYLQEELYHGKVAARVEKLHTDYVEPILRKIAVAGKNVDLTLDDVNLYLHARHAPERNAAMAAINPNTPNNTALSGMSDADAAKVLADFGRAGKLPALQTIAKDVDTLLADTRTALVADGLEEAGTVQAWEAAYQHYVPLMRDIDDRPAKGSGFSVRGPEAKRATGSNRQVVDILANIVTQAETAAIRAEKAEVGRALLEMAKTYPNADFWTVDTPPTKPRVNPNTGLVERSAVDPLYQTEDNVVMVKEYGATRFIVFNKGNERAVQLARAMKNLEIQQLPKALRYVGAATRFMASLLTQRNPEFWFTNLARDLQGSAIQMNGTEAEGLQGKVLGYLPKALAGMRHIARGTGKNTQWARYAQEMKDAGGTTGYMQIFDNSTERMENLQKEVDRMNQGKADPRRLARSLLEFVDDYNDVIENGMRLAVFQAAREAGVSTTRAASIAKNITVNFNRKGNASPWVNSLYMFFNAGVQGTARLTEALATSNKARIVVGGLAGAAFVMDIVNRALAGDDDETKRNRYDLINEFEKSRNWIIMGPDGKYVKVPLPLGFHIFHNAGRLIADGLNRKDPRNAAEYGWAFASTVLDAFNPMGNVASVGQLLAPSVADPAVQLAENKNFMGGKVYRDADMGFGRTDPRPAYQRYFETTPDFWKAASKTLNDVTGGDKVKPGKVNIEPDILRHVYAAITGGPGRALDKTVDTAQATARGEAITPARVPFVHRFLGEVGDRQKDSAYFEDMKRAAKAKDQFDYFVKAGRRQDALEVLKELGEGDVARGRKVIALFEQAKKDERALNRSIRKLREGEADDTAMQEQLGALKKRRSENRRRVLSSTGDEGE